MNIPILPSKILILFVGACLAWIGLIALAVVFLMGGGISLGWIIGGALGCSLVVWMVVMSGEYRDAMEDPDTCEADALSQGASDRSSGSSVSVFPAAAPEEATGWGLTATGRFGWTLTERTTLMAHPDRHSADPHGGVLFQQGMRAGSR